MPNQFVAKTQGIIEAYDGSINSAIGSPLYYVMILPASKIYEDIQGVIDETNKNSSIITATNKAILLPNFGLPPIEGRPSIGKLKLIVSADVDVYTFPIKTSFMHGSGEAVESTEDVTIVTSKTNTAEITVQTPEPSELFADIGEVFESSIYGNLVTSATVSTQISGGALSEIDDALLARIKESLSQSGTSRNGIRYILLQKFPGIIDIAVMDGEGIKDLNRKSGVHIAVYCKLPLESVSMVVKSSNNEYAIEGVVADIIFTSFPVIMRKMFEGTAFERVFFTRNDGGSYEEDLSITYTSPVGIKDIQAYVDDDQSFPMGVDIIVKVPDPVMVSGTISVYSPQNVGVQGSIKNYINSHGLGNFIISDLIESAGLVGYKLPITLFFANKFSTVTETVYNIYPANNAAYYYLDISIVEIQI